MILADENISQLLIDFLIEHKINVLSIRKIAQGVTDEEVIAISLKEDRIILTEDKDFGEWVFAHGESRISVIFLRYALQDFSQICFALLAVIKNSEINLRGTFTTITPNKVRVRKIQ